MPKIMAAVVINGQIATFKIGIFLASVCSEGPLRKKLATKGPRGKKGGGNEENKQQQGVELKSEQGLILQEGLAREKTIKLFSGQLFYHPNIIKNDRRHSGGTL